MALDFYGNEIPVGRLLTTWEYDYRDPALCDNLAGFWVSAGYPKDQVLGTDPAGPIYRRLVVVVAGQDSQEQPSFRCLYKAAEILTNPETPEESALRYRLLRNFDFLFVPAMAQVNVRDGWSRYVLDGNGPSSKISKDAVTSAIENWCSDHPGHQAYLADPQNNENRALFCILTLHSDVLKMTANATNAVVDGTTSPVAPYLTLQFPGYVGSDTKDDGVLLFRDPKLLDPLSEKVGFEGISWPELTKGDAHTIVEGSYGTGLPTAATWGGTTFYFELPWNAPWHKAGVYQDEENERNFAEAFLSGIDKAVALEFHEFNPTEGMTEVGISVLFKKKLTYPVAFGHETAFTATLTTLRNIQARLEMEVATPADLVTLRQIAAKLDTEAGLDASLSKAKQFSAGLSTDASVEMEILKRALFAVEMRTEAGFEASLRTIRGITTRIEQEVVTDADLSAMRQFAVQLGLISDLDARFRIVGSAVLWDAALATEAVINATFAKVIPAGPVVAEVGIHSTFKKLAAIEARLGTEPGAAATLKKLAQIAAHLATEARVAAFFREVRPVEPSKAPVKVTIAARSPEFRLAARTPKFLLSARGPDIMLRMRAEA